MSQDALVEHYDQIAKEEADKMLRPLVERVTREYLLVDRKTAYKVLSMSESYFKEHFRDKPQLKLIEHKLSGSTKVYYDPNELKRAVLSVLDNG